MKFLISCYNIFRITEQLWQSPERKVFGFEIPFSLQSPRLEWFSKPIYYHDITVEVKNNLVHVNISGTIYYEDGIIFEDLLSKIAIALPLCLDDWDCSNVLEVSTAKLSGLFHSGELVLKMILKDDRRSWFGFQVGCQPFSSSNFVSHGSSDNEKLVAPALPQSDFNSYASLLNA